MGSVTYYFNFGERGMSDEVDYTINVTGDSIPSNAVITSGTFSFTIGVGRWTSNDNTMRLRKFYINGLENYIGYGKAYGDSTWWDISNRITFEGNLVISNSSPSAFTSGSFSLLLQLSYGGTFSGVNGREGSITINYQVPPPPPENPTITSQPTISSINPTSGASTTVTWSTATVSNQGNSTIYYQYFVGPNSTYSDSYHIGTTTGTSATITEAQIISKCGNGFGASSSGGTCYFFVRAYWDNGSTQGGWTTPTNYKSFTYYPTINAPTNFSITPTTGQSTVLKWNNVKAGNNSDCLIILYIDNNQVASGIQGSNGGYTIGEDVWKTLGEGDHSIKIAHEYYGRYAYTSSLTFTYKKPYQTINYYTNGNFVPCKVFYYTNNEWKLCNINYYTNGSWKPCSTT